MGTAGHNCPLLNHQMRRKCNDGRVHILERCNECSGQRGHTLSIGAREGTRLGTLAHSFCKARNPREEKQT